MKKKPNTQDQFLCPKGEKVTFTFTTNNGITFLVTREFENGATTDPDIADGKLSFRISADPALDEFTTASSVLVMITYEFNAPGSYDVKITGSQGGLFKRNISHDVAFNNRAERTYRFFLDN
ncbi:MAG TPA: hypothetical protein VGO50_20335 [Pyrinomonadaceae bacterium]|jgi:hypothetical protein|nr:hypothetical protein [Pyrinomonadaceae bacterium]